MESEPVTAGWVLLGLVSESEPIFLQGIDLFSVIWSNAGDSIITAHPQYPQQRHRLTVWSADHGTETVRFAAGELSAGAWAFYIPE